MEEVRQHCTEQSCWLVAHGRVFDVTTFLLYHPGGSHVILRYAGSDATEHFDFHSLNAQDQWKRLQIGVLEGHTESSCSLM